MSSKHSKRRVAITGIGAVTPIGNTIEATWNGLLENRVQADKVKSYDASTMPTKFGYEVSEFELNKKYLKDEDLQRLNLAGQFGINAAVEALEQSGILDADIDRHRIGTCLGVGMFSPSTKWYDEVMLEENFEDPRLKEHIKYWPNFLTSVISRIANAKGAATTIHTACASSGQSLGEAYEMVAYGDADVVITGGADSMINPYHMAGFNLLGALSKRNDDCKTASRPFDAERDGFVLGEGACMLIFEDYEHAKKRGAKILGEICGYGITESAYRITDLHPEGEGPKEAMEMAINDAGARPSEVGYINAHGTSTHLNDKCETLAVSKVFPSESCDVHVGSSKSTTGHLISAAGAIEFAICVKALMHQTVPPNTNLFEKDPEIAAKLAETTPIEKKMEFALSNSVGFGGSNTALVARRV